MSEEKSPKVWERTIDEELLKTWQKLKRKKDPETMAAALGVSRPVIDRALIYGYVSMPDLVPKINKFFEDRLTGERGDAQRLNKLATQ